MQAKQKILVTGTSGFVGGRIVELLHLTQFGEVRAGVRTWSSAARIVRFPVEVVLCDIMQPESIAAAMKGVDAVVHCAYSDSRQVIVEGTRNMLEAALAEGVKRFVFLSTAEVYGSQAQGEIDESAPYVYTGGEYGDSKIDAEKLCFEYLAKGVPITILRPSIIYGPFSNTWVVRTAQRLQSGNWGVFDKYGNGTCNLIYVDDLVMAIFQALVNPKAVGEAFNIAGPDRLTWNTYFERLNAALGLPSLQKISSSQSNMKSALRDRVNGFTSFFVARYRDQLMDIYLHNKFWGKWMRKLKSSLHSTPSVSELQNLFSRDAHYVGKKAKDLLGFEAQFDVDRGVRLSALWLDHSGFLTQPIAKATKATAPAPTQAPANGTNNSSKVTVNQRESVPSL